MIRRLQYLRNTALTGLALCVSLAIPRAWALTSDSRVPDAPFDQPDRFSQQAAALPDLGHDGSGDDSAWLQRVAQAAKSIGEASMSDDNSNSFGDEAGQWAFSHFRDEVARRAESEGQQLLSPYGSANLSLMVDAEGNFNGSSVSLLTPLADRQQQLTFSQLGVTQTDVGLVGNVGLGQRWTRQHWMFGYNAFIDQLLEDHMQRASLGAEAWGDFIHFSANYYEPLSGWQNSSDSLQMRMARGYDITTKGYLPFYRQLGVSFTWEQYLGDDVDLFNSGNSYSNPTAMQFGLSYTPVPLFTLSATHTEGEGGESQDQLGLTMTWRPGVALSQQLSADNVAAAHSLAGSRYDRVERNEQPVLAFRQRKTLSVFLATPPWQVQPGETLALKLQVRNANPVRALSWQGDTQALSLTPPASNTSLEGWSIIIPAWNPAPDASNEYRLSVTVEDSRQQRVTSNWITLKLTPPVTTRSLAAPVYDVMAP